MAQAGQDAGVGRGALLVRYQQVGSSETHSLLGVSAGFVQQRPALQPLGDGKVVLRLGRTAGEPAGFESLHRVSGASLPSAGFGSLLHPLRVAVGERVELLVVGHGVVQAPEARFQVGAGLQQILALGAELNRLGVGVDGERILLASRGQPGEHDGPARVAGRLGDGLLVEAEDFVAHTVGCCVERGFLNEGRVVRKGVDEFDVLVGGLVRFAESGRGGDHASAQLAHARQFFVAG